jgi:hypothetical protein
MEYYPPFNVTGVISNEKNIIILFLGEGEVI